MSTRIVIELVAAGVVVWIAGAFILRLVAASCLLVAGAMLFVGEEPLSSVGRAAAYGVACWLAAELLHRARRGYWRSPTLRGRSFTRAGAGRWRGARC